MRLYLLLVLLLVLTGCQSSRQADRLGAAGGLLGAGLGAVIGHQSGDAATGALLGAGLGAMGGAVVGDSLDVQAAQNREAIALASWAVKCRPARQRLTRSFPCTEQESIRSSSTATSKRQVSRCLLRPTI